jgi:hypothetical protein
MEDVPVVLVLQIEGPLAKDDGVPSVIREVLPSDEVKHFPFGK